MHTVAFVEELAEVQVGPNGVRIVCRSGTEEFAFRCERSLWRTFLEREIRALNEFEIAERKRAKVVRLRKH
jgi:hypothetical protein